VSTPNAGSEVRGGGRSGRELGDWSEDLPDVALASKREPASHAAKVARQAFTRRPPSNGSVAAQGTSYDMPDLSGVVFAMFRRLCYVCVFLLTMIPLTLR
jgi:hypothetical protein